MMKPQNRYTLTQRLLSRRWTVNHMFQPGFNGLRRFSLSRWHRDEQQRVLIIPIDATTARAEFIPNNVELSSTGQVINPTKKQR